MSDRRRASVAVWALVVPAMLAVGVVFYTGSWASAMVLILGLWLLAALIAVGVTVWRIVYHRGKMKP